MIRPRIVALDGHDAAGKTTLANALANAIGALYRRPFHGSLGAALIRAGEKQDFDEVITLGEEGIRAAIESPEERVPIVLDRSWMTVASLIKQNRLPVFFERWQWWIPTALCWADLVTTMQRLAHRDEPKEAVGVHQHYLAAYKFLAERSNAFTVRTDVHSERVCLKLLRNWFREVQDKEWISPGPRPI